MPEQIPLLKGTLDLLILKALSVGPTHGYGLSVWLEERSQQQIVPEDSAIYQALRRMEGRRLVEAHWGVTENNRRARFYALTPRGRQHLSREAGLWMRYTQFVTAVLEADGGLPDLEVTT